MLRGIMVILHHKKEVGQDPFGKPIYEDEDIFVDDVLVAPGSEGMEVLEPSNLTGRKAVCTLAIPKDDENEWEGQDVSFFGHRWHVIGIPSEGISELIPLRWNKKVMVERYGN